MWYVYVLYNSKSNKLYTGQTDNLERRVREHNEKKGKHYTANYDGEWRVIYSEEIASRKDAIMREKQLKSYRGREFIKQYIPR